MNYLTMKLWFCKEIVKQALYFTISSQTLSSEELKLYYSQTIKTIIKEYIESYHGVKINAFIPNNIEISAFSKAYDNFLLKNSTATKIKPGTYTSNSDYIANFKLTFLNYIESLQESYSDYINNMLVGDAVKTSIVENSIDYEQFLLLIKEPIKFNIQEISTTQSILEAVLIDNALPFEIITITESTDELVLKFSDSKKFKINLTSQSKYNNSIKLMQYYLLNKYDDLTLTQINNNKLAELNGKEI